MDNVERKGVIAGDEGHEAPLVSIIIPVYNEEPIIYGSIVELIERMGEFDFQYEIMICENGSTDKTLEVAKTLERKYPHVRAFHAPEPNYGAALRFWHRASQRQIHHLR